MNEQNTQLETQGKSVWVRPVLDLIEAGSAESTTNSGADGGGGFQGS